MKTLLMAPELFRSEGGISRILRLYLKALAEIAGPGDEIGYVALNDLPVPADRIRECTGRDVAFAVGCDHGKLRFISSVLRHGFGAGRVICGHMHQLPVIWLVSLLRPGLQYYLVAHGVEVWRPFSPLEKWSMRRAHRILCISEYTRRQMLRFDPKLKPERLVIVPNTFDPSFAGAKPKPETANLKAEGPGDNLDLLNSPQVSGLLPLLPRGAPGSVGPAGHRCAMPSAPLGSVSPRPSGAVPAPVILVVSRLTAADRYKGVDTMIEAMPGVLREFPGAQLRIVGGGDDLPRLQALAESLDLLGAAEKADGASDAEMAKQTGMLKAEEFRDNSGLATGSQVSGFSSQVSPGNAVHFAGIVDDSVLRAEYAACDIFALPSRKEGFGLVYLEALTYGKPCLAARAGGAPEVIVRRAERDAQSAKSEAESDVGKAQSDGSKAQGGGGPRIAPHAVGTEDGRRRTDDEDPQVSAFSSQVSSSRSHVRPFSQYLNSTYTSGPTEVGYLVEYADTDEIALAFADLIRHPREPVALQSRAEEYSFPNFKRRLAEIGEI